MTGFVSKNADWYAGSQCEFFSLGTKIGQTANFLNQLSRASPLSVVSAMLPPAMRHCRPSEPSLRFLTLPTEVHSLLRMLWRPRTLGMFARRVEMSGGEATDFSIDTERLQQEIDAYQSKLTINVSRCTNSRMKPEAGIRSGETVEIPRAIDLADRAEKLLLDYLIAPEYGLKIRFQLLKTSVLC